jgi:hypothetical protein
MPTTIVYFCCECGKPVGPHNAGESCSPDFVVCIDCEIEAGEDQRLYEEMNHSELDQED